MPHLIDAQPAFDAAAKIAAIIAEPAARARFATLLAHQMLSNENCARALTPDEASQRSLTWDDPAKPVLIFDPPRPQINLARRHARAVRDAALEYDLLRDSKAPLAPRERMLLRYGEEWLRKLGRMSYPAFMERAQFLLAARKARLKAERDSKPLFPVQCVHASDGKTWRRLVSITDLRRAGSELHNCLAGQSGERHGYARRFKEDWARFWALTDAQGVTRAVVMVERETNRVAEARGFRNAPFPLEGADFDALVAAQVCRAPERERRERSWGYDIEHILPQRALFAPPPGLSEAMRTLQGLAHPRRPVRTRL